MTGRGSRRRFLAAAGSLAGAFGAGAVPAATAAVSAPVAAAPAVEPFWGARQGGILTPRQAHTCFAAFDLQAGSRAEVAAMLRAWTAAAARMTAGDTAAPLGADASLPAADSGEAIGLPPARLTLTFGFGPGLFVRDGHDRYGLASQRPAALADLPRFDGDQLQPGRCGGDLSVQACADDPQVAMHAIRQLRRLAYGAAELRWLQTGFAGAFAAGQTPRNLMGFRDGTQQPAAADYDAVLWAGSEAPPWLRGGTYVVVRRIRLALEHWDRTDTAFQEQVMGRRKQSGAPLGARREFDAPDLAAQDAAGNPVIAEDAHVRLGAMARLAGAQMLRRGYGYNDGANLTAERWPPWRQGIEFDAGLLFVSYQRDPMTGFVRVFEPMARLDALGQFATHTGSALFAVPPGAAAGGWIGEALFGA